MPAKVTVRTTNFRGIDQNPSLLGFGCMRFPTLTKDTPEIDESLAQRMIDLAYSRGVTYYDTAYPYHNGLSELFIGKALKKYPRESFLLASKMPSWLIHSVDDAKRIFTEQLQKCQVDYFDYYLCHALSTDMYKPYQLPGVMDYLTELKNTGKIRHLGFSFHDTPDVLQRIIQSYPWDFVQIQCNYLDWTFQNAKQQYKIIEAAKIPCIIMEPVRGGTLATLCEESQAIFKAADSLASVASWAIRYAASKPNVLVVLSGMSNEEQTLDNLKTMTDFLPITDADQLIIDQALSAFLSSQTIPCTGCRYCLPCPHGVQIPLMFKIINDYAVSGKHKRVFLTDYEAVLTEERAANCVACGICMTHCPQKIQIPDRLHDINDLYTTIKEQISTIK